MKPVNVKSMTSSSSGKEVANQFIINNENGCYFQSYRSIIAFEPKDGSTIQLDETYWNYSRTTTKYLSRFLGGYSTDEIKAGIKSGRFILTNLN